LFWCYILRVQLKNAYGTQNLRVDKVTCYTQLGASLDLNGRHLIITRLTVLHMQIHTDPMFTAGQEQTPPESLHSQHQSEGSGSFMYHTDEWFRDEFKRLYDQVANFVVIFFCQFDDIPLESNLSPWTEMSSEFLRYSAMVAEPDDSLRDWNRMLLERNERRYLLVGVLARILEVKVFGELLFGGSKGQKKQLEDLERSSIEVEGT